MLVSGTPYRTIWLSPNKEGVVRIIDQRALPWKFEVVELCCVEDVAIAIRDMWVRGAGLIGATAGYGMYLAARESLGAGADWRSHVQAAAESLIRTRPTAVNLSWAVERQLMTINGATDAGEAVQRALQMAEVIADEDAAACRAIGQHGLALLEEIVRNKLGSEPLQILTHCNAGWLAFVDFGSATAPIYAAHDAGIPVHVWVDETRPRNQGARLTAWELAQHGVPYTVIADNTGGHLMQQGMVDCVITGADRVTRTGDVANKIGTYLKALAAKDNAVPFYVALPSSTIDWTLSDGTKQIPIEQRHAEEVTHMEGLDAEGRPQPVRVVPEASAAANYAFDVTPARLVTALITERGISPASEAGLTRLYPES